MKTDLSHLPQHKQDELNTICDIILEHTPDVRMIILFGSYARGNWVEDTQIEDGATHVYESDLDILVITKSKTTAEDYKIHDEIEKAIQTDNKVSTPYGIIYHCYSYVQKMILEGHYFFCDIKKEGIHLYKTGKHNLAKIKIISPEERKILAQEHFDKWLKNAKEFYGLYESALEKGWNNKAAFNLHQTTESLYSVITLVFVNYRFRMHDIEALGHKAVSYDHRFAEAFPMETPEEKGNFKLLKHAYVDARYKDSYEITKDQLQYLADRVKVLIDLTKRICGEKIESFV